MRVLLTTDTIGGVWTFTKELATGLLQSGHAVALVSFGRMPSADQTAWCSETQITFGSAFRYDASAAPLEWMPGNGKAFTAAEPLLRRIANEFQPDILHSSQFCFGNLPVSIPRIITAHSDVLSWADACRPMGFDSSDSGWLARYRVLVQQGLDAADAVVTPTQWMLDALGKNFHVSGTKHVILNGRNLEITGINEHPTLQAVSAGRIWDEAKNMALLSSVQSPFPILVAGDQYQEGIAACNHPANITLLGLLDESELFALFQASSIYLATSIYEPFGLAPLEAALCGCAVVANNIPSFREVWGDAVLYFDSDEALDYLLAELHASPAALYRLRRSSHLRALQLSRSRMVESYLALYNRLLQLRQKSSAYEFAAYA